MNFGNTPHSIENRRKTLLIYAFATLGAVFLLSFGILSLVKGRIFLAGVIFFVCVVVVGLACFVSRMTSAQPASLGISTMCLVLACYLVLTGGVGGTGVYWSYITTMLMVLLVGPRVGIVFLAVYMAVIAVGLLSEMPGVYDYTSVQVLRVLSTFFGFHLLLIVSEWVRVMSYGAITSTSEAHRYLANTDPLTSTLNRSGVKNKLDELDEKAEAAIALIDIDHFKKVNDQYGHDAGDRALIELSAILESNTKGKDLVARWGGEEFLLLFPNTSVDSAARLVNAMREQMEREPVQYDKQVIELTFSGGVTKMTDRRNFERAVSAADDNLYKAKASGRNQVIVTESQCLGQ